ncbi:MAG: alpha-amylase family glycosyl hydrolase [Blautia sp.]
MAKWYEEAVFYHMYPIGMTGAPRVNKEEGVVHRFQELERWIPHLKDIGVTAVYIGPLFESTTHGYDTKDYKKVDQRLGDNEDFVQFVKLAHENDIKVVVDGVFNHTGREFFAFQDIQQNREESHYCGWYKGINFGWNNPYNDGFGYEAWRNCFELVNLNLQNPEVKNYLYEVIDFWIDTFDIDGIRLDCADCLDFGFMEEMRRRTEARKEDFWLMGEVIHGDYSRYIQDGNRMLHSVTNYELHKGLYSGHNDHNYFEIAHTIRREFDENGGIYRGMKLYSFVDNHDVDRIMSKLNTKEHIFPVYTLLFTLPGIPSIYYGSEWGIEGSKNNGGDDALRPAVEIEKELEEKKDSEILQWVKQLGEFHRKYKTCLAEGRYRELILTNKQYAFARMTEQEGIITVVNNDENPAEVSIPVPVGDASYVDYITGRKAEAEDGRLNLTIEAAGSVLLEIVR